MTLTDSTASPTLKTSMNGEVPEIDVHEVQTHQKSLRLIDVRRPDEFNNELGHIANATLVTLGPELENFLHTLSNPEERIVFVCRSGGRSATATLMARELGLTQTYNMTGGMLRWNQCQLPVEKN